MVLIERFKNRWGYVFEVLEHLEELPFIVKVTGPLYPQGRLMVVGFYPSKFVPSVDRRFTKDGAVSRQHLNKRLAMEIVADFELKTGKLFSYTVASLRKAIKEPYR